MKLLNAFIVLLCAVSAYSQNYSSFPLNFASWTDQSYFCDFGGGSNGNATIINYNYSYNADTIINATVYHELNRNGEFLIKDCSGTDVYVYQYYNPQRVGYLREDSAARIIYFMPRDTNVENILYDFNLNVGDTISATLLINPPFFVSQMRVASIDTFLSDESYRRYNFEIYDTVQQVWFSGNSWIEGIGSTAGLLYPAYNDHTMGAGGQQLICFSNTGKRIYPSFSMQDCEVISSIVENELAESFSIFPNPANDVVEIDLTGYSQYHPLHQFYLFDVQGKLVRQVALPYLSAQFKVNDLPSGTYHWKVAVREEVKGEGKLEIAH